MILSEETIKATGIRFSLEECRTEVARGRLYIMYNDLHEEPFGFIEDLFVNERYRSYGYGSKMIQLMVEEAKKRGCYKVVAMSRKSRKGVHKFYQQNGFQKYGHEFRLDLN